MPLTTIRQKMFLLMLGVGLAFALLETGLRLGGWLFSMAQEQADHGSFEPDVFRIMCIGESTTALGGPDSYPSQLETLLQRRYPARRIEVINRGMVSKSSRDILEILPGLLDRYRPHVVIAMIGVNDRRMLRSPDSPGSRLLMAMRRLRTVRLFELLMRHIRAKWDLRDFLNSEVDVSEEEARVFQQRDEQDPQSAAQINQVLKSVTVLENQIGQLRRESGQVSGAAKERLRDMILSLEYKQIWHLVALGRLYRLRQDYARAVDVLRRALSRQSSNAGALIEMGRCYKERDACRQAVVFFRAARRSAPHSVQPLLELMRCWDVLGQEQKAYRVCREILSMEPDDARVYPEVGLWLKQQGYDQAAIATFLKGLELNPYDYEVYEQLAEVYADQGKTGEAEIYYLKAQQTEKEMVDYLPGTINNYNRIAEMILQRGIRLICMQYPLREVDPLRAIFPFEYRIIFVSNRENFERALEEKEYTHLFSDFFGGDFGHGTRAGNRLIAENVARVIGDKIFSED